jgi:hypothetical protein
VWRGRPSLARSLHGRCSASSTSRVDTACPRTTGWARPCATAATRLRTPPVEKARAPPLPLTKGVRGSPQS